MKKETVMILFVLFGLMAFADNTAVRFSNVLFGGIPNLELERNFGKKFGLGVQGMYQMNEYRGNVFTGEVYVRKYFIQDLQRAQIYIHTGIGYTRNYEKSEKGEEYFSLAIGMRGGDFKDIEGERREIVALDLLNSYGFRVYKSKPDTFEFSFDLLKFGIIF